MSETAELIRVLRERGLTQTEISRRTGIPQPRLSRWQGGNVSDAADDALKLAELVRSTARGKKGAPKAEPTKAGEVGHV